MPIQFNPPLGSSTGGAVNTASNGLNVVGTDVQLGGVLTQPFTGVDINGNSFGIGDLSVSSDYVVAGWSPGNFEFSSGATDLQLVWELNPSGVELNLDDTSPGSTQVTNTTFGSGNISSSITSSSFNSQFLQQPNSIILFTEDVGGQTYGTIQVGVGGIAIVGANETTGESKNIGLEIGLPGISVDDSPDLIGMVYGADYSANNVANPRWIPDKAYVDSMAGGGGVSGSGTANVVPKWTASTTLADSLISDNGTKVTVGGELQAGLSLFTDGTQGFYMGGYGSNNYGAMWPQNVTPGPANYTFIGRDDATYLNSSGLVGLSISDNFVFGIDAATVYAAQPVHAYGGLSRFTDGIRGLWIGNAVQGSDYGALYAYAVTPGLSNHTLLSDGALTYLNGANQVSLEVGGVSQLYIDGFAITLNKPLQAFVSSVAGLPGAPSQGYRAFVNDALTPVFGSTVVGGGSVGVPVYYDGAAWKVG